jgi:hypothetical protein
MKDIWSVIFIIGAIVVALWVISFLIPLIAFIVKILIIAAIVGGGWYLFQSMKK